MHVHCQLTVPPVVPPAGCAAGSGCGGQAGLRRLLISHHIMALPKWPLRGSTSLLLRALPLIKKYNPRKIEVKRSLRHRAGRSDVSSFGVPVSRH